MALPPDLARTLADEFVHQLPDLDPEETREWQESLDAVAAERGAGRARFLVAKLLERVSCPVHVQADEAPWVSRSTGIAESELATHRTGDTIKVGEVQIELVHTPGHTPGSQCILVDGRLISGDTLFLDGCGRTDLPGSDPEQMYESLQRLAALPPDTIVFPGHRYSLPSSASMEAIRESNYVFRPRTKEQWLMMFGR